MKKLSGVSTMNWFKKYMTGRYGGDQLSLYLLGLSLLTTILGSIAKIPILIQLSYIPMIFAFYRFFSKDIEKRRMENYKFAIFISPLYAKFKKTQTRFKATKTHKYFKCPQCKGMLRVPKSRGKILVTCPKCKARFNKKT